MRYLTLTVRPDDVTAAAWNDCLDNSEFAGFYTSPEFFDIPYFRSSGAFAILAERDGVVHGVATGVVSRLEMSCGLSGSPQICIRRNTDAEAVGRALAAGLKNHGVRSTKFVSAFTWGEVSGFASAGFRFRRYDAPLSTILLDLSRGTDVLLSECHSARRVNIRRAIKTGVEVLEMNVERDFDDYYALYSHWCELKQLPRQPYDVQRAVFESKGNRLLLVARHDGRMIGVSTFRFRRPGIMEYTANVSRHDERKLKQNDLLMWRAIEWATRQANIRYLSMAGAHTFLQRFGGEVHPTYRYSLDLTTFRRRDLAESAHAIAIRTYRALPNVAKSTIKKLLQRGNAD
jgi:hypothetical protein